MAEPYTSSKTEPLAVRRDTGDDVPRTYSVHPEHFPTTGWQLASLMNGAYRAGVEQAKRDIRHSLGIFP